MSPTRAVDHFFYVPVLYRPTYGPEQIYVSAIHRFTRCHGLCLLLRRFRTSRPRWTKVLDPGVLTCLDQVTVGHNRPGGQGRRDTRHYHHFSRSQYSLSWAFFLSRHWDPRIKIDRLEIKGDRQFISTTTLTTVSNNLNFTQWGILHGSYYGPCLKHRSFTSDGNTNLYETGKNKRFKVVCRSER